MGARRWILIASGGLGAVFGFHAPDEGDVFWHLALGRAVLRAGSRTVPEPYVLSAQDELQVVPEWLWGILTYGSYELGGFVALTVLTMVLGCLAALLGALWVDRLCAPDQASEPARLGLPAQLFLSALALTMVAARLRLRPELLACALLLGFLLLARGLFAEAGPPLRARGAALVGLCVLWSQVHGSAVLAPVLLLLNVDARAFARGQRGKLGALCALLVLGVFSCAHGLELVHYVGAHASSDAAAHILDMARGDWASFAPDGSPISLAMGLCVLSWLFALALAPFRLRDALQVLLGLALYLTATRFGSTMALIGMPLSAAGIRALAQARRATIDARPPAQRPLYVTLSTAAALLLMAWQLRDFDRTRPLFSAGLSASLFPLRAAAVLGDARDGARVYTALAAGAALGFLADGKLAVAIDSRIPLHFGDADFGSYRDATRNEAARSLYFRRFGIDAAVVKRDSAECRLLQQGMRLISVDARYATFRPGSGSALPGIDGCSTDHIERGCADRSAVARSVDALVRQRDDAYADWLRTVVALECKTMTPNQAFARLPSPRSLSGIRDAVARSRVRALFAAGRSAEAVAELESELTTSDTRAISVLSEIWQAGQDNDAILPLYLRAVREMDDDTPARERGKLAVLCLMRGDLDCAHFQGLRAALGGDPIARDVLRQVAENHESERVRASIKRWLPLLSQPSP
jgi:hypothetical protein